MGLLDLFNIFKKEEKGGEMKDVPFVFKSQFIPFRLGAYKTNSTDLHMKLKNKSNEDVLTSMVITVSEGLGVDQSAIQRSKEIRLGQLGKQEERELVVPIWATITTKPDTQKIRVVINAHYRSYNYIQNSMRKDLEIRIVK